MMLTQFPSILKNLKGVLDTKDMLFLIFFFSLFFFISDFDSKLFDRGMECQVAYVWLQRIVFAANV